jgi:hypothetical protein
MSVVTIRGVDGLITDRLALARSVIEWQAKLSPVEPICNVCQRI